MCHKQTDEHDFLCFSLKATLKTEKLRKEKKGKIYYKHKIREILNFGRPKHCYKISRENFFPNLLKELFLIPNLKFQIKL